jgi:FG-GAP-like repeat/PASTA domain/FG-GAP repeat
MKAAKIALLALLVVGSAGAAGAPGSPGFKASREFDTSAKGTNSVALGDLNGDGKLDVVAAHGAFDDDPPELKRLRLVSVLFGRGDGRFGPSHEYEIGKPGDMQGAFSIAMGDVNGDGKLDVVTGNLASKSVSLLVNDGHGALEPPVNYSLGREPADVALADLNGDGKLDIATGNPNTVSILLNNGDGTFGAVHEYPAGRSTWAFAVADLSGDGRPDIATANRSRNSTTVLVNRGDGSFGAPVDYRTGPGPSSVSIGDVNGDGKNDVVTANGSSQPNGVFGDWLDTVSVLLGRGDGTLRPKRGYRIRDPNSDGRYFITVRIADVNGDRKPDLVTANVGEDWSLTVFINRGNGTFRRHFDYGKNNYTSQDVGQGSEAIALGDLNGDHRPDVVEARFDEVSVFVNAPGTCTVPNVLGKKLAVARRLLAERHCAVGKVRFRKVDRIFAGDIWSQRPNEGAVLPKGRKVNLVVGRSR